MYWVYEKPHTEIPPTLLPTPEMKKKKSNRHDNVAWLMGGAVNAGCLIPTEKPVGNLGMLNSRAIVFLGEVLTY